MSNASGEIPPEIAFLNFPCSFITKLFLILGPQHPNTQQTNTIKRRTDTTTIITVRLIR